MGWYARTKEGCKFVETRFIASEWGDAINRISLWDTR